MAAGLVAGVTALVVRFVRSSGEERLQLKWFAAAAVLVVVTLIAGFVNARCCWVQARSSNGRIGARDS